MGNHLLPSGGPERLRLTVADVTGRFPWPDELRRLATPPSARPMEWVWRYELPLSPDELWRHVVATSRFNRAIGLSPMHFEERGGVLHGRSRNAGFMQEWVE